MRTTTTRWGVLVAAVAMVGGLAACSGDDDTGPLTADDAGESGQSGESGGGEARSAGDQSPSESLGTTRAQHPSDPSDARLIPLRLDITRLERHGELVELAVELTNEAESDDESLDFVAYDTFGDGTTDATDSEWDVDGIGLVDVDAQRMYLPVVDADGLCLCSNAMSDVRILPGASYEINATIGGLPDDVETVDLHVPGFPAIIGVEIS